MENRDKKERRALDEKLKGPVVTRGRPDAREQRAAQAALMGMFNMQE